MILIPVLAIVAVLLPGGLPPGGSLCAQDRQASPAELTRGAAGKTTTSIVALLQYGQDRCSRVGQRLETYWQQLEGEASEKLLALEHYMLTRTSADLAGARKALDLARGLLTRAGAEVTAARREALENLYEMNTTLCRVVAQPTPPMTDFHDQLNLAQNEIDQALGELGNLVAFPERQQLLQELEPFQPMIDSASDEARDQVRKELEVRRPEELPPSSYHLMHAWHQNYEAAVVDAKTALRAYLNGRKISDSPAIQLACRNLLESVIPLLTRDEIFNAPDPALESPLRDVYKAMRRLGNRCTAGRFVEADKAYKWLESSLDEAAAILTSYSLEP